jgi:hypothetical protein
MTPDPVVVIRMRVTAEGRGWFDGSLVVASTHPRFEVGKPASFKALTAAIEAGTEVTVLPPREQCSKCGHVWGPYEDNCKCE